MVVMDANSGKVMGTADIGKGSDGCVFDSAKGLAFSSNGDGTITAVGETAPGIFGAVATIQTQPGARTMTIDPKTHRLYLSAATAAPVPEGQPQPQGRRNFVPGSFVVLVVGE